MMKTVKVLCRRFSVFSRTELRSISSVSPNTFHYHTQSLSSFSPTSLPHNFLHTFPNQSSKLFCSQSFSNSELRRCWNCNSSATTSDLFLVCNNCRCIQPVDPSIDYFRIFGLEQIFDIDESNLEGMYKDWQKKLHPDLVHSKSESEKEYAAEQSARVIDAYKTLRNSLSRAIYLMKLRGVHVDEEQTVSDPELLAEVQEKLKQWSERFAGALKKQDTEEALNVIRRMTYYKRANEEIVKRL
ncbi:iron-sulfur cluster co-chaperone protein HscB homolog isoform X2 [Beta vulgaris subsp. vulgaris]|uniref:iron-sulfur cluster co-chaperone protein HscB homolog isoform X2 n=1 Tax=Beta vulgaris subsp. vulgaris TaxID=3555 RepID=UPI002036CCD8|nr:iron-sulfur cluster co-chaperone protein HscB homolog isoform X2 [Beta vulgaris subsp. vulgaris]